MWNTGKNFFVSEPILIRFGVQMYLGDILAHTKSYQDWLRIGCAGQISILLHKLLWCSISLLWKNDIFWHLDWFFEIFGNELQIFLHGWLEGLQGFHLERVWLHENFYFLVRKCLDFWRKSKTIFQTRGCKIYPPASPRSKIPYSTISWEKFGKEGGSSRYSYYA